MNEIWKDIKNYEGLYQVSNLGNVKRILFINNKVIKPNEKVLKQNFDGKGNYKTVMLCKNGKKRRVTVHRLVAETFIPNPNNLPQVNHKDENKINNTVNNLEWCTVLYNNLYGGRASKIGKKARKRVLQYNKNGEFVKEWEYIGQVEKELGLDHSSISACCKNRKQKTCGGYIWKYKEELNKRQ